MRGVFEVNLWVSLSALVFETSRLASATKIIAIIILGLFACLFGFLLFCVWPVAKIRSMKDREER
jgi:hypothetical protein